MNVGSSPLELWGGAECTIVRLGDEYRNQAVETGHRARSSDFDRMAALGLKRVRFPILWEDVAPDSLETLDFAWTDDRLARLREHGVDVIAGLLHHGSGPGYTSLVDPEFPRKLGEYAAHVAERYPWIDMWTPVNEPLTTARFSGLYGHWYPHGIDERTFLRALVNQCLGTLAAMHAIRRVNPNAKLVQTEDLGKTFATPPLVYQAEYENLRRWLSLDLLAGRLTPDHGFYPILIDNGVEATELEELAGGEACPDMLGINHYLTSERFLDHRLHLYPEEIAATNGRDSYADVEAVRVEDLHTATGIALRLREAWDRYRLPIAITEVHHGCTRDEQLRWFAEVWKAAQEVRDEGLDLRAVTLWSLFGNVDWRSLITRRDGVYDVGVFDGRAPRPRPTILAAAARAYAQGKSFDHPVLDVAGWWRRPQRLYPWHGACKTLETNSRKLLISGATGTLGMAFAQICEHRGLPFCLTDRDELDGRDETSILTAIERYQPWAVINAAGLVRVADAEQESKACLAAETDHFALLAQACSGAGLPLVTFSSDLVFDGKLGRAYREDDSPSAKRDCGRGAAAAVRAAHADVLIVRTSALFGPWDQCGFAIGVLDALSRGGPVHACRRTRLSPTYVPDLCHAVLDLLVDGESGLWHVANEGTLSWHEFAVRIAEGAGYDSGLVLPIEGEPSDTTLATDKGQLLRPVEHAIDAFLGAIGQRADQRTYGIAAE